jgi:hypothetical protein
MDLLGRKLGLNKGQAFTNLLDEVQKTINSAKEFTTIKYLADKLELNVSKLKEVGQNLIGKMRNGEVMNAFANAHPFLDVTGDTLMAWMLLWRAVISTEKLKNNPQSKDIAFYEGQLKSAQFYINSVLPVSIGKMNVIMSGDSSVIDISEESFGAR